MSEISYTTFEEILPLWQTPEMWGDEEPRRVSSMKYYDGIDFHGGNELNVYELKYSVPRFLAHKIKDDITGCVSVFWIDNTIRFRGLYVKPEYRGLGISEHLLRAAINATKEGMPESNFGWALAGPNSTHVHKKVGFRQVTPQYNEMPDGNVSKHKNSYLRYDW